VELGTHVQINSVKYKKYYTKLRFYCSLWSYNIWKCGADLLLYGAFIWKQ